MEADTIRETLLKQIGEHPGATKNQLYREYGKFEEALGKFAPMYNILQVLISEGLVKKDGKKKNTGHYLSDAVIPDTVPKAGTKVANKSATDIAEREFYQKRGSGKKRYRLEKNEGKREGNKVVPNWVLSDEHDELEPISTLFEQAIDMVPLTYRINDTKEGKIIREGKGTPAFKKDKNGK